MPGVWERGPGGAWTPRQPPGRSPHRRRTRLGEEPPSFPKIAWEEVWPEIIDGWDPGQHMMIFGRTGFGKTHAALWMLNARADDLDAGGREAHVAVLETKARDETLKTSLWPIIESWPPTYRQRQDRRIIVWPPYRAASTNATDMKPVFTDALDAMMREGGWTIYVDETAYFIENLKLRASLDEFWNGGRSSDLTIVAGAQRPVWVNRSMTSQAKWALCFFIGDEDDRTRVGEVLGSRRRYPPVIARLKRYECLVIRTDTGRGVITKVPPKIPPLHPPKSRGAASSKIAQLFARLRTR